MPGMCPLEVVKMRSLVKIAHAVTHVKQAYTYSRQVMPFNACWCAQTRSAPLTFLHLPGNIPFWIDSAHSKRLSSPDISTGPIGSLSYHSPQEANMSRKSIRLSRPRVLGCSRSVLLPEG